MSTNGVHLNGSSNTKSPIRDLKPGIYAPIPTFFLRDSEDLDIPTFETHVVRVAKAGVGPLLSGSMGEAHHISHQERETLIRAARSALDAAGLGHVPIIAGVGAGSTREVVQLGEEAAAAGADASIAIISGYYAGALASDRKALQAFWTEVAEKSPIPVIIYNYPGAAGGIDLDSELITTLARSCPNLAGVKLTCGNVGKLQRICSVVSHPPFITNHPRKSKTVSEGEKEEELTYPFLVLGGFTDFLLTSAFAPAHGAITGLANVSPYTIAKLFELSSQAASAGPKAGELLLEAQRIQGVVARADATIAKTGIAGTKHLLEKMYGYGGAPRRPLQPIEIEAGEKLWEHEDTQDLVKLERELSGKVSAA